jgi:serine/threonine protein kinase/ATP/maltotriose-dependent transcriptional regulator MalT
MNFIGQTVSQYRIVEPVGQGGMASVFRAYQPSLQRFVAIKILLTRHALANGFTERFEREARTVAQLNHPNILPILEFGHEQEFSYIVTKLVTGGTLKDRLGRAMRLAEALHIIEQIASALDHAHTHGILHRDIKPSNILLDEDDWVQLTDFGLAKILLGDEGLTASGVGIGTPAYMSPEQGQGMAVDHRTDIYSLGVILYEMVTGRLPYKADTPMAIIFKHIYEPLTLPRFVRPDLPHLVEAVILKALEKKPEDRFASAGEMAEALREAIEASELESEESLKLITRSVQEVPSEPTLTLGEQGMPGGAASSRPMTPEGISDLDVTPPPVVPSLPEVEEFVGREAELSYFMDKLHASHLAVITGMPGVGKTTLATELVQRVAEPEHTFWHSFHKDEGVEAVIWRLAGFLFWRGQPDLWRMLQGAQRSGGQPPPTEVLLDYMMQTLRGQGYLLCLDDVHYVDHDPLLGTFLERVHQIARASELSLIITSRQWPSLVPWAEFQVLTGLSAEDTRTLVDVRGLSLSRELVQDLYAQTEGNAQLLTLAIEALKQSPQPQRLIAQLAETGDVERYLMSEVDASLNDSEMRIMGAVAVLLGYPGSRDAIEAVLGSGNVRRFLVDLGRRHLLTVRLGKKDKTYDQHALVRAFYYDLLGRQERREMHRRAGDYYSANEPDVLRAALHYERAGEYEQAALLVTQDVRTFINQGQARTLRALLQRFDAQRLDASLWIQLNLVKGQICNLQGECLQARDSYKEVIAQLTTLPISADVRQLKARAFRGVAESLEHEAPQEALEWLNGALAELSGADGEEEAAIYAKLGSVQIALGEYSTAEGSLERALGLLSEEVSPFRSRALANLATVYGTCGDIQQATVYTQQALRVSQQLDDYFQMLVLRSNLALIKEIGGDWAGATAEYRQALALAEKLGSVTEQVRIESNLGLLYTKQGDSQPALARLSHALELARKHNLKEHLVHTLSNLAYLNLRRRRAEAAKPLLAEAERLSLELGAKYQLPEIYRGWAGVQLAKGQPGAALMNAERSVTLARELGLAFDEGMGLRVLGQALLANNQPEPALEALETSLSLITADPYEAACTKTEWGRYLTTDTDAGHGRTLLEEARATFQELCAKDDLSLVDTILQAHGPAAA